MRRLTALVLLTLALPLAGCVPDAPPTPLPSSSTDAAPPLFATEEEALAAAEEVYREYLEVWSEITSETIDDLRPYMTPDGLDDLLETVRELESDDLRLDGVPEVSDFRVQSFSDSGVDFYVCHDNSTVRLLDADANDVTPPDRPDEATLVVHMVVLESQLVIDWSELWSTHC